METYLKGLDALEVGEQVEVALERGMRVIAEAAQLLGEKDEYVAQIGGGGRVLVGRVGREYAEYVGETAGDEQLHVLVLVADEELRAEADGQLAVLVRRRLIQILVHLLDLLEASDELLVGQLGLDVLASGRVAHLVHYDHVYASLSMSLD